MKTVELELEELIHLVRSLSHQQGMSDTDVLFNLLTGCAFLLGTLVKDGDQDQTRTLMNQLVTKAFDAGFDAGSAP